nr:phage regulatory CII family protein [Brucella sp. 10RB9212]
MLSGGISCIVPFTRVGVSTLSKYASFGEEHGDSFMPIDVAVEVDRRAQTPTIIKAAAGLLGYELIPASSSAGRSSDNATLTEMDAHRVMSEAMDVSKSIVTALEDGRIDAGEKRGITKEVREAIRALEGVLKRLEAGK